VRLTSVRLSNPSNATKTGDGVKNGKGTMGCGSGIREWGCRGGQFGDVRGRGGFWRGAHVGGYAASGSKVK